MNYDLDGITNSQLIQTIDEYIHSARDREIMRRRLVDGETYQEIADALGFAPRTVRSIVARNRGKIFRHLNPSLDKRSEL